MLTAFFVLFVLASLATSGALLVGVLPASPLVLAIAGGVHLVFGFFFFRGYFRFRGVHRLVDEGLGELFDLVSAHHARHHRFRALREHYQARRVQGLALTGMANETLEAAGNARELEGLPRDIRLSVLAAEAEANLEMAQPWWAERVLDEAAELGDEGRHAGLRAVRARLAQHRGAAQEAEESLSGLERVVAFPLTRAVRARNLAWRAEAVRELRDPEEAMRLLDEAARTAPQSLWGRRAARRLRLLARSAETDAPRR